MRFQHLVLVAAACALVACGSPTKTSPTSPQSSDNEEPNIGGKGDYFGEDDRHDPYESTVSDRQRSWARATALMAEESDIVENDDGSLSLDTTPFKEERNLCEDANFAEQPTVGSCSSFLVAPDVLVTAGHCVDWGFSCDSARFVFDYGYYEEGQDPTNISEDQVYRCKRVMAEKYEGNDLDQLDYAVIKLQRPVEDREPMEVRQEGRVSRGAHLTLIGTPDGLPTKIDPRGVVFHTTEKRFVATNDSFSGHSGGLVVNNATGKVEAVHVASGGQRYVRDEDAECKRARQCEQANIDGECQGSIGVHAKHWREHIQPDSNGGDAGTGDAGSTDTGLGPDAGGTSPDTGGTVDDATSAPDTNSTSSDAAGSDAG